MYLPSIISAIDKSLQYYAENYMRMNLDGIFGLRLLEGSYHGLRAGTSVKRVARCSLHIRRTVWNADSVKIFLIQANYLSVAI